MTANKGRYCAARAASDTNRQFKVVGRTRVWSRHRRAMVVTPPDLLNGRGFTRAVVNAVCDGKRESPRRVMDPNRKRSSMATTQSARRPAPDSEFMNTEQVAEWIGVPAGTLRNWRHRNIGPACFSLNNFRVVYRRRAVEAWLATQELSTKRGGVE